MGVVFGSSRDMGALMIEIFILIPLLGLALFLLCAAWADDKGGYQVKISTVLFILFPFIVYAAYQKTDELHFTGWSVFHFPQLLEAASKDQVVARLDSWGMAGMENDSYIISDARDDSSSVGSAERWRLRMGLDCEVVATSRMWAGFYVFTTANCGF